MTTDTNPADALELEPASPAVKRYQYQKHLADLMSTAVTFVWLAVLAFLLGPVLGQHIHAAAGNEPWLQVILMALVVGISLEAATLPIDFWSSFIVEHQHQLSNQSLAGWIVRRLKAYAVGGTLGLALMCGLYAILNTTGEWWWLAATAAWLAVTLLLGRLVPVVILPLFYTVTRLEDESLLKRLRRLCEGTGLSVEGIYRLDLSEETRKANAALAGLGRTRRVLLGDTLLESFTPEEIEVVFAHEVGHHVHRHLIKTIVLSVLLSLVGFRLVDVILRAAAEGLGYAGLTDPAAMPLVLFVLGIFGLILSPLQNAISRHYEVQCDQYALDRTGAREAFRSAFVKLARMNKADPDPHPLIVWLFYDHPPIRERLALAASPE